MDDTLEAMIGASLLFGENDLIRPKTTSLNPQIREMQIKTREWYQRYRSPRKEQQVLELLKTTAGQDQIRKELNMDFEYGPPMLKEDIAFEYKWALTLMLAKNGGVPSWQKELFFVNDYVELAYLRKQQVLLKAASCDVSVLDYIIANSYCGYSTRNEKTFYAAKDEARRRRESKNLAQWSVAAQNNTSAKSEWFLEHTDSELERNVHNHVVRQSISSQTISKYRHLFSQNGMGHLYSAMWRQDVKVFFYKWITAFEMAEQGKIPSWQINWSPEFQSDYLCFVEQIKIIKKYDYDPWPLLLQLPETLPTKHRTLETVIFDKKKYADVRIKSE